MDRFRIIATLLFAIGAGFWLAGFPANAQDLRAKAEVEGKLGTATNKMFYSWFLLKSAREVTHARLSLSLA